MHQEEKLLREEMLRDTHRLTFLRTVIQEACNYSCVSARPVTSVGRSWLLVSKCKLQGSHSACWGWAKASKEGAESIYRRTDVSIQLFSLSGVPERWFLGQGESIIWGYLDFGAIHSWSDNTLRTFCLLWFVISTWPKPHLPRLKKKKNINLKNIVKNKYFGGGDGLFSPPPHKDAVEGLDVFFVFKLLLLWHTWSL